MRPATSLTSFAAAAALVLFAQPAWAGAVYRFAGAVTSISNPLIGGGLVLGDSVHMTITLGPTAPDSDPVSSVGLYANVIDSWTVDIGSFTTNGVGGDALVCDSPDSTSPNCGSASSYPWWNDAAIGMDGVRFVTRKLTSPPIVLNGFSQACALADVSCGNANVYDDEATALTNTDIPPVLDPVTFGSGNGRVLFGQQGFVGFSMSAVPEPSTYALVALSLGLLGFTAGRRKT